MKNELVPMMLQNAIVSRQERIATREATPAGAWFGDDARKSCDSIGAAENFRNSLCGPKQIGARSLKLGT
jgi:hypothetical protein